MSRLTLGCVMSTERLSSFRRSRRPGARVMLKSTSYSLSEMISLGNSAASARRMVTWARKSDSHAATVIARSATIGSPRCLDDPI